MVNKKALAIIISIVVVAAIVTPIVYPIVYTNITARERLKITLLHLAIFSEWTLSFSSDVSCQTHFCGREETSFGGTYDTRFQFICSFSIQPSSLGWVNYSFAFNGRVVLSDNEYTGPPNDVYGSYMNIFFLMHQMIVAERAL